MSFGCVFFMFVCVVVMLEARVLFDILLRASIFITWHPVWFYFVYCFMFTNEWLYSTNTWAFLKQSLLFWECKNRGKWIFSLHESEFHGNSLLVFDLWCGSLSLLCICRSEYCQTQYTPETPCRKECCWKYFSFVAGFYIYIYQHVYF